MRTIYEADDGKQFDTIEACRAHEELAQFALLLGMTESDIAAALTRENAPLADALEKAGSLIAKARREAGELRRTRKNTETDAPLVAASASQTAVEELSGSGAVYAEEASTAVDPLDTADFLGRAFIVASQGRKAFNDHYALLTNEGRMALEGHVGELIKRAEVADLPM